MPEPCGSTPTIVLALDFGTRQIGIAVGQTVTGTAQPLRVIRATDGRPDWQHLTDLIAEWRPQLLLVGLPLNMDGTESEFCARARQFARRLHGRTGIRVTMVDERLSTAEAKSLASGSKKYRDHRANPVDALAAALTLETWLRDRRIGLEP